MPRILESGALQLSPAQAHYVIERLMSEKRIAPGEIARYVGEIPGEIAQLETRLQQLRDVSGSGAASEQTAAPERSRENGRNRTRRRRGSKRRGNPLAGRYMGYMRQVPEAKKAKYWRV